MKISELLKFPEFYNTVKNAKLPLKTAYKLSKLNSAISKEIDFYQDKLKELIDEYGLKDTSGRPVSTEDGQGIKLIEGKEQECIEKINELTALEADLPDIKFILNDFGTIELSTDEMMAIMPFIIEE